MASIFLPRHINTLVVSYGGVGTTFLMKHLADYRQLNDFYDEDRLKHRGLPPLRFSELPKCIYVYGDPVKAVLSLFRRGYQMAQSQKLQHAGVTRNGPIAEGETLDAYARAGIDRFRFEEHFTNWHDRFVLYPTLFVRYEALFDHVQDIADFLELPTKVVEHFPEKKARTKSAEEIAPETMERLDQMYGGFHARLQLLDDVEYKQPQKSVTSAMHSAPYREAMWEEATDVKGLARNTFPAAYARLQRLLGR